ncbi:MAG TPA: carboxypeptidase-like regulatory domain-containing protein [Solirubrobacterales bacterium]|nr:carboxypeptidase-like regulatory domain-containing protein [Solirubrobacterales bacterium]
MKAKWDLDTASYPFQNGANSVQVCASEYATLTDAARSCTAAQNVTVDNSCTESAVPGGENLSAHFTRSHKDEVVLPFGRAAKVAGEVTNNAGDAISGATVCVQMQTQGSGGGLKPVATATTDAHGHFVYKVPPGPNRKVFLGYRHDTFQVGRSVHFFSRAKIKFKIDRGRLGNGGEIKMWGKLPGPRAAGRVAILEAAALHSNRWYEFGKATTNRHGVFHARYRFDATTVTTVYKIRAVAPRQHDWPWEGGRAKPVLVEVRG